MLNGFCLLRFSFDLGIVVLGFRDCWAGAGQAGARPRLGLGLGWASGAGGWGWRLGGFKVRKDRQFPFISFLTSLFTVESLGFTAPARL